MFHQPLDRYCRYFAALLVSGTSKRKEKSITTQWMPHSVISFGGKCK